MPHMVSLPAISLQSMIMPDSVAGASEVRTYGESWHAPTLAAPPL